VRRGACRAFLLRRKERRGKGVGETGRSKTPKGRRPRRRKERKKRLKGGKDELQGSLLVGDRLHPREESAMRKRPLFEERESVRVKSRKRGEADRPRGQVPLRKGEAEGTGITEKKGTKGSGTREEKTFQIPISNGSGRRPKLNRKKSKSLNFR